MKDFIKKLIEKKGFFPIVTTVLFGLFIYGAYALYYEFSVTPEGVGGILYMIIGSWTGNVRAAHGWHGWKESYGL